MSQTMRVWITKYALTTGVFTAEVERSQLDDAEKRIIHRQDTHSDYYLKPDWHETKKEAEQRVLVMIEAKIKSLRKSLEKYNSMLAQVKEDGMVVKEDHT